MCLGSIRAYMVPNPRMAPLIFNSGFVEDFTSRRINLHEKSFNANALRAELPQGRVEKFGFNIAG